MVLGHKHGDFVEKKFLFKEPVELKPGRNDITILGTTVGLPVNISIYNM